MSAVALSIAAEIVAEHDLAQAHKVKAIDHAIRAGTLLLRVKAEVGHGNFRQWLEQNVTFTARTAQRYMHAALPTPKPIATRCRIGSNPPKAGTKAARTLAALDRVRHRDEVIAHVGYLVGTDLPEIATLDHDQIALLANLCDRLNTMLEALK